MGQPGAKKSDQIVSATPGDVHILMIPSPGGPIPTPIPHPCSSVINDGLIDSVKVMGQPGAVKGSTSKHTPPHVPMGPGPFQKPPANKGEIVTGSANVFYEDKAAAMLGDTGKMCSDPSDTPVGKVMGTAATVLVGGGGSGSDADRAAAAAAAMKAALAAAANMLNRPTTGHPIDITTGTLVCCAEDALITGMLPLQFTRTYLSTNGQKAGPIGAGWAHNYQESLEVVDSNHPEWGEINSKFTAMDNPSPNGKYLIYRSALGEASTIHDIADGKNFLDDSSGRKFARDESVYILVANAWSQHHFQAMSEGSGMMPLTRVVDRHGNMLRFSYDKEARLVAVTDPYGRVMRFKYDDHGRIVNISIAISPAEGAFERQWCRYEYSDAGDLIAVHDRGGGVARYRYQDHLIVEDKSADGYSFYFQYDKQRRCIRTWGQDGFLSRWLRYDSVRNSTWEVNGEGESTIHKFDALSRPLSTETMRGPGSSFSYDDAGRLGSRRDANRLEAALAYDKDGVMTEFTNAKGVTTNFKYDELGRCVEAAASDGRTVQREYDDRYNIIGQSVTGQGETRCEYDAMGRMTRTYGPWGSLEYAYDQYGHVKEVLRDGKFAAQSSYDTFGKLMTKRVGGRTTKYEWDDLDRMVKMSVDDKMIFERGFDFSGRMIWEKNIRGRQRRITFTGLNATEYQGWRSPGSAVGAFQKYKYDTEGRILQVDDERGTLIRLSYDRGKLVGEEFIGGWRCSRSYDDFGFTSVIEDSLGTRKEFSYEPGGRLMSLTHINGSKDQFEYDDKGRLIAATTDNSNIAFECDDAGKIVSERQEGWGFVSRFNETGVRVGVMVEGFAYELQFEFPGELVKRIVYGDLVEEIQRSAHSQEITRKNMNSTVERISFDAESTEQIIEDRASRTIYRRKVEFNDARRVTKISDSLRGARACEYDDDFRLTAVKWDRAAPATAAIPADESYFFDGRNNLVRINGRAIEPAMGRDPRPRQINHGSGAVVRLEYNAAGQLGAVRHADGRCWEYLYDALGRRTRKTCFRGEEELWRWEYLWDKDFLLAERRIEGENVLRRLYVRENAAIRARIEEDDKGARAIVYCNDMVGTPELCTDERGEIVWHRETTAFSEGFEPGPMEQNIGFPGQYFDEESGLFYNRYRYYDPSVGRYIQPDPISLTGGWNLFAYPADPFTGTDPLGLATRFTPPSGEHVTMMDDDKLLKMEPVEQMKNTDPEDVSIHQFVGGTQEVIAGTGQNLPHYMGEADPNRFAGQNTLILESHGVPGQLQFITNPGGCKEWISGEKLGEELAARGFKGNQIVLVICNAATKDDAGNSVAQQLTDTLKQKTGRDVEVIAATGVVSNFPDGSLFTSSKTPYGYWETPRGANFYSFSAGRDPIQTSGTSGDKIRPLPATPPPTPGTP